MLTTSVLLSYLKRQPVVSAFELLEANDAPFIATCCNVPAYPMPSFLRYRSKLFIVNVLEFTYHAVVILCTKFVGCLLP